jgi:hypothetical protein
VNHISVLVPTRGRPANVRRLVESAYSTSDLPPQFVFYVDEDDPQRDETVHAAVTAGAMITIGPRIVLSEMWNRCAEVASHDVMMHCGDDIVFRTSSWDSAILEVFDRFPDKLVLVHGDDGYQRGNIATHGFYHRNWVDTLGYFVPPYFSSDYNDLWLTEVADAIGRRVYLPNVYTEHMHPSAGKGELDQTHIERLARHNRDDVAGLYASLAQRRVEDAAKLRNAMVTGRFTS